MSCPVLRFSIFWLATAFLVSCGGHTNSDNLGSSAAAPAAIIDPATTATLSGRATLAGVPPAMQRIDMSSEPNCKNASPVFQQTVIAGEDAGLANVVIYIKSGLGNYRYEMPQTPVALHQKGCMYEPHIITSRVDQPLQVDNDDSTVHNVHPEPKINNQWNRSQPAGAAPLLERFPYPELAIPIVCNVHPWMRSYAFVFDNPYHAVTTSNGRFELKNIPPGQYTLEAWQEKLGVQDQQIDLAPKQSKTIAFVFSSGPSAH